jgi:hypothetical protein
MNDLIQSGFDYTTLPTDVATKAQIAASNIKLRLKRTVEDIIEIGRELTAIKPSLEGVFDAWFERETGLERTMAYKFMQVNEKFGTLNNSTSFSPTVIYLLSAPSTPESVIDKAVEKAESGEKVTVADVKDWKAELEAERQARLTAEQRAREFGQESNERRKKIRELETQVDLLKAAEKPEPEIQVVEKIPADYESAKQQAAELQAQTEALQKQLDSLKSQQTKLVNDQVKAKLQGYQAELDKMEADKRAIEDIVARKKAYLDSLSSEVKRIETHQEVINGARLELISLAAFLNDLDPIEDPDTIKKWLALADMHEEAMNAIRMVFGNRRLSA